MVIRRKMFIIISLAFAGIVIIFGLSGFLLLRGFSTAEDEEVRGNVLRAGAVFTSAIDNLAVKVHDWSAWDDTYEFIQDHNADYVQSNLAAESLQSVGVNMIIFIDRAGNLVKSKSIDINTLTDVPIPTKLMPYLQSGSPLIRYDDLDGVQKGVIALPEGLLMVAARPIETSKQEGPMRGTIIFGKYIDQPFIAGLSKTIDFPLSIEPYNAFTTPTDFLQAKRFFEKGDTTAVLPTDQTNIAGYMVMLGVDGQPVLMLRALMDRHTLALGRNTILTYLIFIFFTLVIISIGMWFLIDKFVLSRMSRLTSLVATSSLDHEPNITLPGNDEFSNLAKVINTLTTKLQQSVEYLAEAKAKDEAILAGIGDGLVAIDTEGRVVLTNGAFETILGLKSSEVQGKKFTDIVHVTNEKGEPMPASKRLVEEAIHKKSRTTTTKSSYYKRKDGSVFPVSITISPIIQGEEFLGAVEIFRDSTKEKAVDKAKTEFVSLASHQLRTPLTAINWYAEMLLAGDAGAITPAQERYLKEIYSGNQRMVELVNALLNVSRLELGTFVIEAEPTDAVVLTQSVIREQEPLLQEKQIKLATSFEKNLPLIKVDPKLLRMIVQNLVSNAIKYTPNNGQIDLTIGMGTENNEIRLTVSDTGYGIPKDQQDKIFTKLFRADNARSKDTEGTGLGLYIVKSIVEHSGGKVWFESVEHKGTIFTVTLPVQGRDTLQTHGTEHLRSR